MVWGNHFPTGLQGAFGAINVVPNESSVSHLIASY
jgi:hypothetical protein